jgi:hypothetical protein
MIRRLNIAGMTHNSIATMNTKSIFLPFGVAAQIRCIPPWAEIP